MTNDGPLNAKHPSGAPVESSANIDQVCLNAELIYQSISTDEDYHRCMNGEIYLKWLKNRLIPTFKHLYPNKKMILVLDNASYHHIRGDDWITPSTMNKYELAHALIEKCRIKSFKVYRTQRNGSTKPFIFKQISFYQPTGPYAPSVPEMREELRKFLSLNPDFQRTKVRELFDEHQYTLIYTPPYTPETQPIELMWGYIKNYVAKRHIHGRTLTQLRQQTLEGCYGNTSDGHEGVTAELCVKFINNRHDWCNQFIEDDSMLSGDLHNLKGNADMDYSTYNVEDEEEEEALGEEDDFEDPDESEI